MRSVLTLGVLAIVALFAAPTTLAQDSNDWQNTFEGQPELLTIEVGPNAVFATLHDITVSGEMASDARWAIDNLDGVGDGDGTVAEEEIVTFEVLASHTINENLPATFEEEFLTIDGHRPSAVDGAKAVELVKVDVKGAEGTTSSTADILTDITVKLRFDSVDQRLSSHSVDFKNVYGDFTGFDASEAPPLEVRILGYNSWAIYEPSVAPEEATAGMEGETLVLTNSDVAYFEESGSGLFFEIRGDPDDQIVDEAEGAPGVGSLAFLSVLGTVLVALRRRG